MLQMHSLAEGGATERHPAISVARDTVPSSVCFGSTFEHGDDDVNNRANDSSALSSHEASAQKSEWPRFLLLAFVGLPITMTLLIAAYGFVVWFLQILVFGPPS